MRTTLSGKVKCGSEVYTALVSQTPLGLVFCLVDNTNTIVSVYKSDIDGEKMAFSDKAREYANIFSKRLSYCNKKNGVPSPSQYGAVMIHNVQTAGATTPDVFIIGNNKTVYEAKVVKSKTSKEQEKSIYLCQDYNQEIPDNVPYVKVTTNSGNPNTSSNGFVREDGTYVPMRSVEEIALYKDTEWLRYKNYYVINDEETAEQLFTFLDNYNGPISYDTETTGLRVNCFGKVGSKYEKELEKYNQEHPDEQIREDKLVGIIFCVEENTSYYFPAANKRFKNLYEDKDNAYRKRIIQNAKAYWTLTTEESADSDMRGYILNTPEDEIRCDVVLMERVRQILRKKHIVTHHGSFDWKVDWQYEIDTNIQDDTMIIHQLIYKFRDMSSGSESSKLKILAKKEFNIDQWELDDFFPTFKEDDTGKAKKSGKKNSNIDFSYMDLRGAQIYAPADGDVTFMLFKKYIKDLYENHADMEYIYRVEVLVSCAIGYMEFYGLRIAEEKIENSRITTTINCLKYESLIRQSVKYSGEEELRAYNNLVEAEKKYNGEISEEVKNLADDLRRAIDNDTVNLLNISSPPQMSHLFYDILKIPTEDGSRSVKKDVIKVLASYRNEDGSVMYPVVKYFQQFGAENALLVKFFDKLPEYMYPGGYIFPSFNQLSTNTGRMSCKNPNAQQFPKVITKIVIPRDGYVTVDADYSQIEARVITALAGNVELAKLFANPDNDYHTLMASLMYEVAYSAVTKEMRSAAKAFNFGIPFGMGNGSLAIRLHGKKTKENIADAAEKREMYFKNQPNTRKMFANVQEMASVNGYTTTQFNRKRFYKFSNADGSINESARAAALRQAGNAVIQGCLGGDTRIQTKEFGIVKIKDYAGYNRVHVWDGDKWSLGDIMYSGKKQKCIVKFSNGQSIICSPIHRFKIVMDTFNGFSTINPCWEEDTKKDGFIGGQFVRCKHLKNGMAVEINTKSDLVIENYDSRFNNTICYGSYDDDSGDIYTYTGNIECAVVESVEITDEYIDMYDVCNTDCGYYVADGLITHNTAADIFKISVARQFSYIRSNRLMGLMLIIDMIHDEQLLEVNIEKLNIMRIVADIANNMQFELEGYPPLYVGAGVACSWAKAKGSMNEIHPHLMEQFIEESKTIPIFKTDDSSSLTAKQAEDYFYSRIYTFRRDKVLAYINNPENWNTELHPVIGGIINLQFNYGRGESSKGYKGPNGETYDDKEFVSLNLKDFMEEFKELLIPCNGVLPDYKMFEASDTTGEAEEKDVEYEEGEEDSSGAYGDMDDIVAEYVDEKKSSFKLIEETGAYGVSISDLIQAFKVCVIKNKKICGIDARKLSRSANTELCNYLAAHNCEKDDEGALEVIFLKTGNIMNNTGIYVNNVSNNDLTNLMR